MTNQSPLLQPDVGIYDHKLALPRCREAGDGYISTLMTVSLSHILP